MRRELHFPTPIYHFDIKDKSLNIQLEKDIMNWMQQDKGVFRTNVKGWHSHTNMHTKPEYARLVKALHEAQDKIYVSLHNKHLTIRLNHPDTAPERLWREVHYEPLAGRCIMFPAWLIHCVEPNNSNEMRISVSFNFLQKTMFV